MTIDVKYLMNRRDFATTLGSSLDSVSAGLIPWVDATSSQTMTTNTGYVANNSSLVILTLPTSAAFGTILRVLGKGAGGWRIGQNALQTVHVGNMDTSVGTSGSISSTSTFDNIYLLCTTANTNWTMLSMTGNLTIT